MTVLRKRPYWSEGKALVGEVAEDVWRPGYTVCDFIDPRISVAAQYALYRLYVRGGAVGAKALLMLAAVKRTNQLTGVYKQDEAAPAKLAASNHEQWWNMLKSADAQVFTKPSPPMMVFAKRLGGEAQREALANALLAAWDKSGIGVAAANVPPPSGQDCRRPPPPPPPKSQQSQSTSEECPHLWHGRREHKLITRYNPVEGRSESATLWMDATAVIVPASDEKNSKGCRLVVIATVSAPPVEIVHSDAAATVQIVDNNARISSPLEPVQGRSLDLGAQNFSSRFPLCSSEDCNQLKSLKVIVTGSHVIHGSAGDKTVEGSITLQLF